MRRGPSPLRSAAATVLVCLLATACSDGSDADPEDGASTEPTTSASSEASESEEPAPGPLVAGSGAGIDPANADAWCGAITPEQLTGLLGVEVAAVDPSGAGVQQCTADLPGSGYLVTWGAERTGKSFERYAAGFDRPPGVHDPRTITLDGGKPAVLAPRPESPTAFAGTVVDGRLVQVAISGVVATDADSEELAEMAGQILAVYVD
jgi:hypothetical protein